MHGVLLEVKGVGVLVTGASGAGKSDLALDLIDRGHKLVADDAPQFTRFEPGVIEGRCPELLADILEVRGLGLVNIRAAYGNDAVKENTILKLIIHLERLSREQFAKLERLNTWGNTQKVLGVELAKMTLPITPSRNLALLVEAAVRNFLLYNNGYDVSKELCERQRRYMLQGVA